MRILWHFSKFKKWTIDSKLTIGHSLLNIILGEYRQFYWYGWEHILHDSHVELEVFKAHLVPLYFVEVFWESDVFLLKLIHTFYKLQCNIHYNKFGTFIWKFSEKFLKNVWSIFRLIHCSVEPWNCRGYISAHRSWFIVGSL